MLLAGSVLHAYDCAPDTMRFYNTFSKAAPHELSLDAALVTAPSGERFFNMSACYIGPSEEGERVVEPLRAYGNPVEDRISVVRYVQIQSAGDSLFPRGGRYYWKAQFMRDISDQAIDVLLASYATAPKHSLVVFQQVGGAIARVPITESPYSNRHALYDCFPISIWDDPADDEVHVRWARDLLAACTPTIWAKRIQAAYGEN